MGEEMVLGFDAARAQRLLVIPPLFDEANKFRHQIFEIMRRIDTREVDCFLPDLPGCNESTADLTQQTLGQWRAAVAAAAAHFRATHVLAIRSGGWLVPGDIPGWLYAPVKPRQVLRSLLRARIIAAREAGRDETSDGLLEVTRAVSPVPRVDSVPECLRRITVYRVLCVLSLIHIPSPRDKRQSRMPSSA